MKLQNNKVGNRALPAVNSVLMAGLGKREKSAAKKAALNEISVHFTNEKRTVLQPVFGAVAFDQEQDYGKGQKMKI